MDDSKLEELEKNIKKFINPLNDWAFKYLFGNKTVLMDFLNDLIHNKDKKAPVIVDIEYLNTNKGGEDADIPGIIYDIRCKTENGDEFIVEMQKKSQPFFQRRVDFYMSKAVASQEQSPVGKWRYNFNRVYGVFFMNFYDKVEPETPIIHCSWRSDGRKSKVHSDNMQYWKIQLPHYKHISEDSCKKNLDYWLYVIANMDTLKGKIPFTEKKPVFNILERMAEYANLVKDDKWAYWQAMDQIACTEGAMEMEYEKGREEGREEERALAHKNALVSAYNLFKSGALSFEQIATAMSLDISELSNYIIEQQKAEE